MYSPLAKGSTEDDLKAWQFRATKIPPCVFWTTSLVTFFPENTGIFYFPNYSLVSGFFPLNGHSLMFLVIFKSQSRVQYFCPVSWQWISKQDAYFFPPLFATVRRRSQSFCFHLVLQVQPGDSFFLQLCFQEKTKCWPFSKLSVDWWGVSSESTPPAAGTLSKKGEIEQNIPELVLSPCRQARRRLALERHVLY